MSEKELIAMCNCPEIQDKWEPKVGDKVGLNSIVVTTFYKLKRDKKKLMLRRTDINALERVEREGLIFIPRIEDVLEWMGNKFLRMASYRGSVALGFVYTAKHTEQLGESMADTPIEALLKAYMHSEYEKKWDGSVWHK